MSDERLMAGESPAARGERRGQLADERRGGLFRPTPEAVGGAVFGGVTGGLAFGPLGALGGMIVGGIAAAKVTARFAASHR